MADVVLSGHWPKFVEAVEEHLRHNPRRLFDFSGPFDDEQALTRQIALGLRKVFEEFYPCDDDDLRHHVAYRQGQTAEDRRAWKLAQPYKWVNVHGLNFVPDVLIRRKLDSADEVLPIEVKLVTGLACSQAVATAIGQAIAYRCQYCSVVVFIGVEQHVTNGDHRLINEPTETLNEFRLREHLAGLKIGLIIREVSTKA